MGIKPVNLAVTVATAGVRVQVIGPSTYVTSLYVEASVNNSGNLFIGVNDVSASKYVAAITQGQGFQIATDNKVSRPSDANGGPEINLNSIFVDAATSGAVAFVSYLQRTGSA